jgi:hypothetical protein
MRGRLFLSTVLALSAAGLVCADEVLDAKLDALKKKAQRRTYSTPAILNDQNLIVPQAATVEEQALDKKIREMEKEDGLSPGIIARQTAPPRAVPRPEQEAAVNWLTPALLNEISGEGVAKDTDSDSWIIEELNRQKEIKQKQLTPDEEQRLIDQRLSGGLLQDFSAQPAPLNTYDESLQSIISAGSVKPLSTPSYLEPGRSAYGRSEESGPSGKPAGQQEPTVFSTLKRRESTAPSARTSSASRLSEFKLNADKRPSSAPSAGQTPSWQAPEETFRQRVRRAAPGYEANPFEENPMPGQKSSIWD